MSEKIIDPHVHFFNLNEGQYSWLQGETPPAWPNLEIIKTPSSFSQLQQACPFELTALVHIEAGFDNRQPVNELTWLAKHLAGHKYKAVSYAQIDKPFNDFSHALGVQCHPSLVGIRDITEGDDAIRLLSSNCLANLDHLSQQKLVFEAQFNIENSAISQQVINYCQQLPDLKIVINHAGLPNNLALWQANICQLAKLPNCFIKFSGFELLCEVLQAKRQYCFDFITKHFSHQHIMFASNFPVCQINASYQQCWQSHFALCKSHNLWQQLSYKNAQRCYQI